MKERRYPRKELMPLLRPQLKIVGMVCLPLVLTCIAVSFFQTYFFLSSLRAREALHAGLAPQIKPLALLIAVITLLFMVPICFFIAVLVSHRILGPMRRFGRELIAVGEGRLGGVFTMRQGDDLLFLGDALSEMKGGLAKRIALCRGLHDRIEGAVARTEAAGEAKADIAELREAVNALRVQLNSFELTKDAPLTPDT